MASRKQNKAIVEERAEKRAKEAADRRERRRLALGGRAAPVNCDLLAPYRSYGLPEFVTRGFYEDREFTCRDCGKQEVWRATQQKWWYEVAKGYPYAAAVRCRICRRAERIRVTEARRSSEEGRQKKQRGRGKS